MMQTADLRNLEPFAAFERFDVYFNRRVLIQRKVGARVAVVLEVRPDGPPEMAFVEVRALRGLGLEDLKMSVEGGLEEFEEFFDTFAICSESRATRALSSAISKIMWVRLHTAGSGCVRQTSNNPVRSAVPSKILPSMARSPGFEDSIP